MGVGGRKHPGAAGQTCERPQEPMDRRNSGASQSTVPGGMHSGGVAGAARSDTFSHMQPSDYAAEELALWEQALVEQREAERDLEQAREKRQAKRVLELRPQVEALRTRADLLLAEAIRVKCSFRNDSMATAWVSSTQPSTLDDHGEGS